MNPTPHNQKQNSERPKTIWAYPWDLLAEGLDVSLERIARLGITKVSVAVSYHDAMALMPHNPQQKVRFLEDGAIYFRPHSDRFRGLALQPRVSELAHAQDPLEAICQAAGQHGLDVIAWAVCCHNSYQGMQHLDLVAHNVFGDPYPFALCPAQPDVRSYLQAVMQEISAYSIQGIQLESYGYMGFYHGYHHERIMLNLGPLARYLMGVCFCPECEKVAVKADLDFERIRHTTRNYLLAAFEGQVNEPEQFSMEALGTVLPELPLYQSLRDQVSAQLVHQLGQASTKPLYIGGASPEVLNLVSADIAEVIWSSYRLSAEEVAVDTRAARALVKPPLGLSVGLEVTPLFTPSRENLLSKVQAAWEAGAEALFFYNYGLMPLRNLEWLGDALR